jgi:hypothetical protein
LLGRPAVLLGLVWISMRMLFGGEGTDRLVAKVTQTPIEVSWRAVPISLRIARSTGSSADSLGASLPSTDVR